MRALADWPLAQRRQIAGVFTDIDDTLTTHGAITSDALQALHDLQAAGLHVIAITGRPVGWCAERAPTWPVDAVVAENGAVALVAKPGSDGPALTKLYQQDAATRSARSTAMQAVAQQVLRAVPGVELTRDHGGRETDVAFDCAEFAQLSPATIQHVLQVLRDAGMYTTVSSIHIHGCFDDFNKWKGACWIARELFQRDLPQELERWLFVGDSGNDQPMFQHFTHSVGVANIRHCAAALSHLPRYITVGERGTGFAEVVQALMAARRAD